jgi:Family of unknown function (DUF6084)
LEAQTTSRGPLAAVVDLDFGVERAETVTFAAVPTIAFSLRIACRSGHAIQSIMLGVQVQIAARRRAYSDEEEQRLVELFGTPDRWATTLRTLLWLRTTQVVPGFTGETQVGLQMPCTYDFEVTGAQYLQALGDGPVPLEFLFSGTVFYTGDNGMLQTAMVSWDSEADFAMPVQVWRDTMDHYFPGSAWLRLDRETFERLAAFRAANTLPSWQETVNTLIDRGERDGPG